MIIKHLESDHINRIALQLGEDFYGANGDLDDCEIKRRLIETIVAQCNYHIAGHSGLYEEDFVPMSPDDGSKPVLTLWQAADLILGVWKYMDREANEQMWFAAEQEALALGLITK